MMLPNFPQYNNFNFQNFGTLGVQYKIAKPEQESESEEDEDDDDVFGPSSRRKENGNWSEDPVARE